MATEAVTALGFTVSVEEGTPATFDAAGYGDAAMTYDLVSGVTAVDGDLGFSFNTQTISFLADGVTKTAKGSKTFSPLKIMVTDNVASTGKTTLEAAAASQRGEVSLKLEDADGNIIYISGVVTNDAKAVGNADNIMMKSYSFQPNYDLVPA
jgi:hypothetical protein